MKNIVQTILVSGLVIAFAGCASASGYDAKRYNTADKDKPDADIDTQPLPSAPKTKIVDPRGPLAPASSR